MTTGAERMTQTRLAAGFEPATREDWLRLVEKVLNGADFEKKLVSRTADGLRIEPLYVRDGSSKADVAPPGVAPFTRGAKAAVENPPWGIHQAVSTGRPGEAHGAVHEELQGGATGIVLEIEAPGQRGVTIASADDMARTLEGVVQELAAVQLGAGLASAAAVRYYIGALPLLGTRAASIRGFLNQDPIGALARWGTLLAPLEQALAEAMALAKDARAKAPRLRTVRVDGTICHEAGATEAQELAVLAATLVAYLRTFEAAEVPPAEAMEHISFALAADTDLFLTIAKMRAARRLLWRVADASGGGDGAAAMHLTAVSSGRMMARRDPWTNMLRTTLACAGAALGGADAVTLRPFTWALGEPDTFARRIARNTQIVLQEESSLGRVLDPAGGSWYVEKLTHDLAFKAWSLFQDIEAEGGIISALGSGAVQARIAAQARARRASIATGRIELTGVSSFPHIGGDRVEVKPYAPVPPLTTKPLLAALEPHRTAEPFEALREAADAYAAETGKPPQIFLASLGEVIDHTARSTWTRNYLAAGGIEALVSDGYRDAVEAAEAFERSGAEAACICSSDALYAAHAMATARALKSAGAKLVLMTGRPGDKEANLRAAGVDQFLFAGQDAVSVLSALQEKLK
jgi:methylmalonyl-CoA mutase